jgi:hypothetical protein
VCEDSHARRSSATILMALAILACFYSTGVAAEVTSPRIAVPMYHYAGQTPQASERFEFFREIFADKLRSLAARFYGFDEAGYLDLLSVLPVPDAAPPSREEIRSQWTNAYALEIMRGIIAQRRDNFYWVTSRIFIGELGSLSNYLGAEELTVELRLSEEEYTSIIDSHSLITLFALAMDARRVGMPDYYYTGLLAAAEDVFADLLRRQKGKTPVQPDVVRTHDAIGRASDEMKAKASRDIPR